MEVLLPCECGNKVPATEMQAGIRLPCRCGREVAVPSLSEMRRLTGVGSLVSPRLTIESMAADGELPSTNECAGCGAETTAIFDVFAICERPQVVGDGLLTQILLILCGGWLIWAIYLTYRRTRVEGTDREARLPLRICRDCQARKLRMASSLPYFVVAALIVAAGIGLGIHFEIVAIPVVSIVAGIILVLAGRTLTRSRSANKIRQLLHCEPVYVRLLQQFPNAEFVVLPRENSLRGST